MHFWAGQLMVGTVVLHMARVLFSGGYKGRRFNWLLGILLLVLTIFLDFTGFALRWDQDTGWALLVGTNLLREVPGIGSFLHNLVVGGAEIGRATLIRFFSWHVFGLATISIIFIAWHAFRVRRDGGISHRDRAPRVTRERLLRTEITGGLLTLAALVLLSIVADAPLGPPTDPALRVGEPHAPWFFLWIQELLRAASSLVAGILVPLGVLTILAVLPYVDRSDVGIGQWFNRQGRLVQLIFLLLASAVVLLTIRALLR
jgi:quinol-cytochrome oxidoreductase complex cytochrome b subunit